VGEKTGIAWTDHTFNPWWGCTAISPGCDHCYAEAWAKRVGMALWGADAPRRVFDHKHWAQPLRWNRKAGERGLRERVFCASMADVFDNRDGLDEEREKLWTLIHKTPHLDWQLLTKRVGNVARMVPPSWMNGHWPSHVWLGSSIVNREEAQRDIPKLLALPAAVRFLSCEPLLERIGNVARPGIGWVIVGGESGGKARPFGARWARAIVEQCRAARVPVFVKQMGSFVVDRNDAGFEGCEPWEWPLRADGCEPVLDFEPYGYVDNAQGVDCRIKLVDRAGADPDEWPEDLRVQEFPL
jgi:protein gp37